MSETINIIRLLEVAQLRCDAISVLAASAAISGAIDILKSRQNTELPATPLRLRTDFDFSLLDDMVEKMLLSLGSN